MKKIRGHGRGYAFSAWDFRDLGTREAVDVALHRLEKAGQIRRVAHGLYDYPKASKLSGGVLAPDAQLVVQAIARKKGIRILPAGAQAANMLGLSDQVPAKMVFATDGPSKRVQVGNRTISFKSARPADLPKDKTSALVIQALKFLGHRGITDKVIQSLRKTLTDDQRARLATDAQYSAAWVANAARQVAEGAA